ncbi:type II RES/Xre toxin-antitoxin system antitoxin [Spartinivicinus ruber]|uniref:type II RES/Xre toxin-antitoxin system antitoxin n=1 Tax=Spartinivicinus ruber TaxID=2683272 RepID=UPI0013D6B648|nr:antitoxin Xre/MbcA/ParS toxin-binding domain-containing protein [Spartinivicinus ruber]
MSASGRIESGSSKLQFNPAKATKKNKLLALVIGMDRIKIQTSLLEGLSVKAIAHIEKALGIDQKTFLLISGMSKATLSRRKQAGRLTPDESSKVYRFVQLYDLVKAMMLDDDEKAKNWLKTPEPLFGGNTPLEHARTEFGAKEVEDLIGRIRHGVFS